MGSRKVFFFDVDGTLIDDETKQVPESALRAVAELKKRGHLVFINSGRTLCFLEYQMELFGISSVAAGCGTHIIVDGNTVMERHIPHERGLEIKRTLKELRIDACLEAQEAIYYSDRPFRHPEIMEELLENTSVYAETEVNSLEDNSFDFDKFCIQTDPHFPERELLDRFFARVPDFECIDRGRGFFECVPKGFSKGTAVQFVMNRYGIGADDAYVFGDSTNDIAMFKSSARNRIIMQDHDTALEPYASFETKSVMEDGIEFALKSLGVL